MSLHLYNTASRKVEAFEPMSQDGVGVYTCGPTVYHHAHLGNLRTYIASDVLVRWLRLGGYSVRHVMNITDVGHLTSDADEGEDKMAVGAAREGVSAWEIAERYTNSFFQQCDAVNVRRPDIVCRATDHIEQQIRMIESLEQRGLTYVTQDGVYFDTSKDPNYGSLARLDVEGMRAGARVDVGEKRNKTDFALWKFAKGSQRQMEWQSPWGHGFPGWHIECSAMAIEYLGEQFDIHTGGIDHIAVHHTNEIAQSEGATGKAPFARYWMHSNFLQLADDQRMAKSSGKFATVFTLLEQDIDPLAFRFLCLKAHYRTAMKFSWNILDGAATAYNRLRAEILALEPDEPGPGTEQFAANENAYFGEIANAIDDDLSTPQALTALQRMLSDKSVSANSKVSMISHFDKALGLALLAPKKTLALPSKVTALLKSREEARAQKDWKKSDLIRANIEKLGYQLEDTRQGVKVRRTTE